MGCDCDKSDVGDPALPPGAKRDGFRALYVEAKSIVIQGTPGVSSESTFLSVPPAAAVDVFIHYRDPATGVTTPPDGNELFLVYAVERTGAFLLDSIAASQVSAQGSGRAIGIRDTPAESFDVRVQTAQMLTTGKAYYDVIVVGWAREPTGIGPLALTSVHGNSNPGRAVGLPMMAYRPTFSLWGSVWQNANGVNPGPQAGATGLLTAPTGMFHATPPTLGNGDGSTLEMDAAGNLKVALTGSAGAALFPAAAALGDTDANPTTTRIGADVQWWDGTQWLRAKCTTGGFLKDAEQFQAVAEDNTNGVFATVEKPLNATTYNATASDIITAANAGVFKPSAGTLYVAYFTNSNAAGKIYALVNKASNPANGDVPIMYFRVPATTTLRLEWRFGKRFSTGIAWAEVTAIAATITLDTADTVANAEVI